MVAHHRPDVGPEYDQGEFPARQVLLIPDVLVRRHDHVELRLFRHVEKLAVFKLRRPPHVDDGVNFMLDQELPHTNRDVLIKQDAQRGDSWRTPESRRCDPAARQTVPRFR